MAPTMPSGGRNNTALGLLEFWSNGVLGRRCCAACSACPSWLPWQRWAGESLSEPAQPARPGRRGDRGGRMLSELGVCFPPSDFRPLPSEADVPARECWMLDPFHHSITPLLPPISEVLASDPGLCLAICLTNARFLIWIALSLFGSPKRSVTRSSAARLPRNK